MNHVLSDAAVEQYRQKGYCAPVPCLSASEVARYRSSLEAMEFDPGG